MKVKNKAETGKSPSYHDSNMVSDEGKLKRMEERNVLRITYNAKCQSKYTRARTSQAVFYADRIVSENEKRIVFECDYNKEKYIIRKKDLISIEMEG